MFNNRRLSTTVACVLLAVLLTEAGKPGKPGKGFADLLNDVSSVLANVKTNVARLEGCGHDRVGAECEKATAVTADTSAEARPDERRIEAALVPKDEKAAVASSGQIVNSDKERGEEGERRAGDPVNTALIRPFVNPTGGSKGGGVSAPSYARPSDAAGQKGVSQPFGRDVLTKQRRRRAGPCRSRNGNYPHKKNPRLYYKCKGGRYVIKKCDKDLVFEPKLQYCTRKRKTDVTPSKYVFGRAAVHPVAAASSGSKAITAKIAPSSSTAGKSHASAKSVAKPQIRGTVQAIARNYLTTIFTGVKNGGDNQKTPQQRRNARTDIVKKRAIQGRKKGCYCSAQPTGRLWESRHATVEQCWKEALRRNSAFLLVSSSGCQYWSRVDTLTVSSCSGTAYHVIDVRFYRPDLARINPDMQFWISARPPTDVIWGTVPNIPDKPLTVGGCGKFCYKFGQDFARVDHRGCRCGMAGRRTVKIRQEDLAFLRQKKAVLDPGITLQLHASGLAGWQCTAVPANFIRVTAAQSLQEALDACRRRRFKFLTPGKDAFYCGNSTDNLERFSRTQCQMNVTTMRSYSVISIKAIERQITQVEDSVYDYVFWWVSGKPPGVFWTSVLDVAHLEQCVLACDRRFVAIGPDGCYCGSMMSNVTSLHVQEWVLKETSKSGLPGQGYLMLDKQGFVNVPEGWHCTTEPKHWKAYTKVKRLGKCLKFCDKDKKAYAAFGRRGCLCGDQQDTRLRRLPMAHCQASGSNAYSVISVPIWRQNVDKTASQPEHERVCWVDRKPGHTQWEVQPGATVLDQCITACTDQYGVKLILLGVDGCECGIPIADKSPVSPNWCRRNLGLASRIKSARAFLLVQRVRSSEGYTPPKFDWIVKENLTKTDHKIAVRVEPWIKLKVTKTTRKGTKTFRDDSGVHTRSEDQKRTNGPNGREVIQRTNNRTTAVKGVEIITSKTLNKTRDGRTKSGHIGEIDVKSQKLVQKERREEVNNENEKHYISAGANDINVKSVKDSNLTIDREIADRLSRDGYKKYFVKGHRTTQTSERFTNDAVESLERGAKVTSQMLKKDVLVNQTHGDSSAMDMTMQRDNLKRSRVKEHSEGSSLSLGIHIEGTCYDGPAADWTKWTGFTKTNSPFKCLCSCLKEKKLYYAIYYQDNGNCFCAAKYGRFGNNTGIITTNGRCPTPGSRAVYDGLKHTHELGKFCRGRNNTSIVQFLQKKESKGYKLINFKNIETMAAKINSSTLKGTHLNRTDAAVSQTVHRWHGKEGTIDSQWRSRLTKGPLKNLYSLRLRVRRVHNFTERLKVATKQDVHSMHSARGVPFHTGDKYTLIATKGSLTSTKGGTYQPPGGTGRLLTSRGSSGGLLTKQTVTSNGTVSTSTSIRPGSGGTRSDSGGLLSSKSGVGLLSSG